jgi:uncharacterized membrane protein YcaP (DUF421 family)
LSRKSVEDVMLAQSIASRCCFVKRAVLFVLAYWSRRSHAFGLLIKGRSDVIVKDGALLEAAARRNRLSEHDVFEDLRLNGNVAEIRDVLVAVLERNGQISVVRRANQ